MRLFFAILLIMILSIPVAFAAPLMQSPTQPIAPDQPVSGQLDNIQQAQQYLFEAEVGQTVTIIMVATSGDLNPYLTLATFEGAMVTTDDDGGGGINAQISFTLETSGSYVVTATRSRSAEIPGSGTYSLTLSFDTGAINPAITPAPLLEVGSRLQPVTRGNPVQGALTQDERFVLYWFEGSTGQTISVVPDTGTGIQPLLILFNSDFIELLRNTPGTPLSTVLSSDGLYFLAVTLPESISTGGNYGFVLGDEDVSLSPPREVEPGQTAITYGERVQGAISDVVTSYTFQFRGTAGDSVTVTMERAGGDLDSYLYLLTSAGVIVAQDDNSGGGNSDAQLTATLPSTGDYLILATRVQQDAGTTTGNYILSLESDAEPIAVPTTQTTPSSASFLPITLGEAVQGEITNERFLNIYTLTLTAAETIEISMEGDGELDPYVALLNTAQEILAENDDITEGVIKDSQIISELEAGTYLIVATRFQREQGTSTGTYTLSVTREGETVEVTAPVETQTGLAGQLNATPLISGETISAVLEARQFADIYTFTLTAPDRLVDFSVTTNNNALMTIILTDERLQALASKDDSSLLGMSFAEAGTYFVFVAPAVGPAVPTSVSYVTNFSAPGEEAAFQEAPGDETTAEPTEAALLPISYGQAFQGELSNDLPEQAYVFTGTANDAVRIRMSALPGSALDPYIELLDTNGRVIQFNDDIDPGVIRDSLIQLQLPADGEYTIRATRFTESGTTPTEGAYEISLDQVPAQALTVSPVVLPIEPGVTVTNEVTDDQQLMFYSFEARSGDLVTIEVEQISGDLDAVLYLYGFTSAGDPIELARNDDSPRGNTFDPFIEGEIIPRAGTYLIAVGRSPNSPTPTSGEFTMLLRLQLPSQQNEEVTPVATEAATEEVETSE